MIFFVINTYYQSGLIIFLTGSFSEKPSAEQLRKIEETKKHPIVFDEDCEELSPATMKAFRAQSSKEIGTSKDISDERLSTLYPFYTLYLKYNLITGVMGAPPLPQSCYPAKDREQRLLILFSTIHLLDKPRLLMQMAAIFFSSTKPVIDKPYPLL